MPYIKMQDRIDLEKGKLTSNAGELNYVLTIVCRAYIDEHGERYQTMNDIIGALEGCKLEFYRRVVSPYEDKKIAENGDVY